MSEQEIFSKGIRQTSHFTGNAFVNFLVPDTDGTFDTTVYDVYFEAGCRNDWHTHNAGQILLCTAGTGYYQEKGKSARKLEKGDVVEIEPFIEHWHGAGPDSSFTHIGISPKASMGTANWISPVTDEEYQIAVAENLEG